MKKITKKNYIIATVISILTFILVGYFAFWYKNAKEYNDDNSVMTGYLLEIGEDSPLTNLNNYIIDNQNTILYMSYEDNLSIKEFENELKELINRNNIKSNFVYINLNAINDKNFLNNFRNDFFSNKLKSKNFELSKQSNLFIFKGGKVESILFYAKQDININDVKTFLANEGVIEND